MELPYFASDFFIGNFVTIYSRNVQMLLL